MRALWHRLDRIKRHGRRGILALMAALLAALGGGLPALAQSAPSPAPQHWWHPAGIIARWQFDVFLVTLGVVMFVFVVVSVLLIYTLFRFRQRGEAPTGASQMPKQVDGNHTLEIIWTLVPIVLLVIMAIPTVRTNYLLASPPPDDPIKVRVIAHQWWWEFEYPELGVVTANEMRIPVGVPVELTLESNDVIHKFWVPQLAGKLDVIPGRVNRKWLQADREGVFYGQCAELCGASHALMRFRIISESQESFEQWVASHGAPPQPRSDAEAEAFAKGMELFQAKGCNACHAIEGTPFQGRVGPDLSAFGSRLTVAAGYLDNTPENLRRWLADPPAVKPDVKMPNLGLTREEQDALVTFLHSL